jgi:hypothetical protein
MAGPHRSNALSERSESKGFLALDVGGSAKENAFI